MRNLETQANVSCRGMPARRGGGYVQVRTYCTYRDVLQLILLVARYRTYRYRWCVHQSSGFKFPCLGVRLSALFRSARISTCQNEDECDAELIHGIDHSDTQHYYLEQEYELILSSIWPNSQAHVNSEPHPFNYQQLRGNTT